MPPSVTTCWPCTRRSPSARAPSTSAIPTPPPARPWAPARYALSWRRCPSGSSRSSTKPTWTSRSEPTWLRSPIWSQPATAWWCSGHSPRSMAWRACAAATPSPGRTWLPRWRLPACPRRTFWRCARRAPASAITFFSPTAAGASWRAAPASPPSWRASGCATPSRRAISYSSTRECRWRGPRRVHTHNVRRNEGAGALQMQAPPQPHLAHRVAKGSQAVRERRNAGRVGAPGCPDIQRAADPQHVATLEARGIGHPPHRHVPRERGGDALDFIATRGGAGPRDQSDLRHQHRGILDEYAVGVLGERRQPLDAAPERGERGDILRVLAAGLRHVDRGTCEMSELAARERFRHFPDEGDHGRSRGDGTSLAASRRHSRSAVAAGGRLPGARRIAPTGVSMDLSFTGSIDSSLCSTSSSAT